MLRQGAETERAVRKAASAVAGVGAGGVGAAYSGATTPLARSGLGIPSPLLEHENEDAEDDETTDSDSDDHVLVPQTQQRSTPAPVTPAPVPQQIGGDGTTPGLYKSSSIPNLSASGSAASGTTLITPSYSSNLTLNTAFGSSSSLASAGGMGPLSAVPGGSGAQGAPTSAPATLSVAPLPSEEADIDLGLVKVSDCDIDSFMMYAALVPEYCRLEGMLVRALV